MAAVRCASGAPLPRAAEGRWDIGSCATPEVFKEVYDTHFAFVWKALRRLRVPDSNLKDAVQDVFLVVHRRLAEFEGRAKLSTWLFGICLRVAKDHRRMAHVRLEVFDDSNFASFVDPKADTGAIAEQRERLLMFDAALEDLDARQRAVFVLFELENMTGDQIAESLEIPLGTAYSRLRLARPAFKKAVLAQTRRKREPVFASRQEQR
jgi:RNA polymerase sigma-70 factor (ECF subfamily)